MVYYKEKKKTYYNSQQCWMPMKMTLYVLVAAVVLRQNKASPILQWIGRWCRKVNYLVSLESDFMNSYEFCKSLFFVKVNNNKGAQKHDY